MDYSIVFFDIDGTLIDSASKQSHGIENCKKAARELSITIPDDFYDRVDRYHPFVVSDAAEILAKMFDVDFKTGGKIMEKWREWDIKSPPPLFSGVLPLLRRLKNLNTLTGILTGRDMRGLAAFLDSHGLHEFFSRDHQYGNGAGLLFGCDSCMFAKPDPRVWDHVFGVIELRLSPYLKGEEIRCLYVGDTTDDARCVIRARFDYNIDFVAITTGMHSEEDFLIAGVRPENILDSILQIREWLGWSRYTIEEWLGYSNELIIKACTPDNDLNR